MILKKIQMHPVQERIHTVKERFLVTGHFDAISGCGGSGLME